MVVFDLFKFFLRVVQLVQRYVLFREFDKAPLGLTQVGVLLFDCLSFLMNGVDQVFFGSSRVEDLREEFVLNCLELSLEVGKGTFEWFLRVIRIQRH